MLYYRSAGAIREFRIGNLHDNEHCNVDGEETSVSQPADLLKLPNRSGETHDNTSHESKPHCACCLGFNIKISSEVSWLLRYHVPPWCENELKAIETPRIPDPVQRT